MNIHDIRLLLIHRNRAINLRQVNSCHCLSDYVPLQSNLNVNNEVVKLCSSAAFQFGYFPMSDLQHV